MTLTARRAVIGGLLAGGGAGLAASAPATAATRSQTTTASSLRSGDLIVGPGGMLARVASVSGRRRKRRVNVTDPATGSPTLLGTFPKRHPVARLTRGVPVRAVTLGTPTPPSTTAIDGGSP